MGRIIYFLTIILVFVTSFEASAVIYGVDDRRDVFMSARARRLVKSTATMVADTFIIPNTPVETRPNQLQTPIIDKFDLDFELATVSYGLNLCAEEKFSNQPSGWLNCSGFLVGEDILITAGHCVMFNHGGSQGTIINNAPESAMCQNFSWVFDFSREGNGLPAKIKGIPADNVYRCAKVLYADSLGDYRDPVTGHFSIPVGGEHGTDYAIIQLDRKVKDRKPLSLAPAAPSASEKMMVLGYPSALPAKYADGRVLSIQYKNYFTTDLDIMNGNSGSAVFNDRDQVVGIVVRGYPIEDYNYLTDRQCYKNVVCAKMGQGNCQTQQPNEVLGTHIQRAEAIHKRLVQLGLAGV